MLYACNYNVFDKDRKRYTHVIRRIIQVSEEQMPFVVVVLLFESVDQAPSFQVLLYLE